MSNRVVIASIVRMTEESASTDQDLVAAEAPLEILLAHAFGGDAAPPQSIGLVMRTPGDDEDLVVGLLVGEQIVTSRRDILNVTFEPETNIHGKGGNTGNTGNDGNDGNTGNSGNGGNTGNTGNDGNDGSDGSDGSDARPARALVALARHIDLGALPATRVLDRTSACGLCGRLTMQAIRAAGGVRGPGVPRIDARVIASIPSRLRRGQAVFAETGGLHAAALCDLTGTPWLVREDVGRHNAVDKVVGAACTAGRLPAVESLLAVSGRVAYEIVQKAAAAGVVGIVAVGAPSSLAVDAARAAGLTLVGFVRDGRFNVYCGAERIGQAG